MIIFLSITGAIREIRSVDHAFLFNIIGHGLSAVIADSLQPDFWKVVIVAELLNNKPGAT